jgi:membrane protein YdbS with pleckstrin-like domain
MSPQLRLVTPAGDQPAPLATAAADARLRLWGAGVCALLAILFTAVGYEHRLRPVLAGPLAAVFLFWGAYLLLSYAGKRGVRYTLTAQRLEIEKGILGKRYESIELWRVRDVVLDQSILERVRGVGRITVYSTDQVEPVLQVGPVAQAKELFEMMRDAVTAARKVARVVPLDSGR